MRLVEGIGKIDKLLLYDGDWNAKMTKSGDDNGGAESYLNDNHCCSSNY